VTKLTPRQKDVLEKLAAGGELTFAKGGGWWLGTEQIGGKTPVALLRGCALRLDYEEHDSSYAVYTINETGREALESGELLTAFDVMKMVEQQRKERELL
jgi:hypothetical protein